jgi:hypothetical protein
MFWTYTDMCHHLYGQVQYLNNGARRTNASHLEAGGLQKRINALQLETGDLHKFISADGLKRGFELFSFELRH